MSKKLEAKIDRQSMAEQLATLRNALTIADEFMFVTGYACKVLQQGEEYMTDEEMLEWQGLQVGFESFMETMHEGYEVLFLHKR